jgi:murein DD-endopeptidase MepM/ murein hydrolase activator NlpD
LILIAASWYFFASNALPFGSDGPPAITGLSLPSVGSSRSQETVLRSGVIVNTVRREELAQGLLAYAGQPAAPEADAAASSDPFAGQSFRLYAVADGDTASAIATRFGIDLQYMLWANPDLLDGELLVVGQMLVIPAGNGILHHTRYGETLSDIADRYGASVDAIMAWPANGLASADALLEGQLIFVPEGTMPIAPVVQPTPIPTAAPDEEVLVVAPPPAPPPAAAPPPAPVASTGLMWPVYGPISSYMDASHPLGIDIDLYNNPFAAISAATSGTVTFAGGNPCCSYGLYVVIVSPDGIETLYAHLSSINVSVGQTVTQGDIIANAGCTGYCTGNHLHFEVIDNGVRVNPLDYLP